MLIHKKITELSKWLSVTERTVLLDALKGPEIYHSLSLYDYVSVVAVDENGLIPLVRQYRPALDRFTIEFPGGLLDTSETPEYCARRELFEETGLTPKATMKSLPCLYPDTGRLENRLWGFFAEVKGQAEPSWCAEDGLKPIFVTQDQLQKMILDGEFNHASHIALFGLALLIGYLKL